MDENNYKKLTIYNINGGAVVDQFAEALRQVIQNIADPNCKIDTMREINIKIKILPQKNGAFTDISTQINTKLAPLSPSTGYAIFGKDENNELTVYTSNLKQPDLPGINETN